MLIRSWPTGTSLDNELGLLYNHPIWGSNWPDWSIITLTITGNQAGMLITVHPEVLESIKTSGIFWTEGQRRHTFWNSFYIAVF